MPEQWKKEQYTCHVTEMSKYWSVWNTVLLLILLYYIHIFLWTSRNHHKFIWVDHEKHKQIQDFQVFVSMFLNKVMDLISHVILLI